MITSENELLAPGEKGKGKINTNWRKSATTGTHGDGRPAKKGRELVE